MWIGVAFAAVLVGAVAPAGKLTIDAEQCLVVALGGIEEAAVPCLDKPHGWLAETLRKVDTVPVDHTVRPACSALVDLVSEVEQPLVAGAVVEPENTLQIVAGAHLRPVAG